MPWAEGQSGNPNGAKKTRRFEAALLKEIAALEDGDLDKGLRRLAKKYVQKADTGDQSAIEIVANRIDGRPAQQIIHTGDDENPVAIRDVTITIVDPHGT